MRFFTKVKTKTHIRIKIFGLTFSFRVKIKPNNKIYIIDKNSQRKEVKKVKGLQIVFLKANSTVEIYEPLQNFKNCSTLLNENCTLSIGQADDGKSFIQNVAFNIKGDNSNIKIGKNLIYCHGEIALGEKSNVKIGNGCMFSNDVYIRTSDFHKIMDINTNKTINFDKDIEIGDKVWIAPDSYILKGSKIADDSIVGTGSIVTKQFQTSNSIIAGNPAKIIKQNIYWQK